MGQGWNWVLLDSVLKPYRTALAALAILGATLLPVELRADQAGTDVVTDPAVVVTANLQLTQTEEDANDPLEGMNRAIFNFNEGLQDNFLRPIVETYNETVPPNGRRAMKNVFNNLSEPVTFVNDLLQFEFHRAVNTFLRMMINTIFGAAGIMDLAQQMGIEDHSEDFGQTLGTWGIGEGFYLVLPILGPSSPRDAVGKLVVDSYFDPLSTYLENIDEGEIDLALDIVDGLLEYADVIEELDQIKKTSVDYYAAIRSLYRQKRKAEISNGKDLDLPPIPDISPEIGVDFFKEEPVASAAN